MKTITLAILALTLIISSVHSQAILEGKSDAKLLTIKLESGEYKLTEYDSEFSKIIIYNLDQTVWRVVDIPLAKNQYLDDIKLISQNGRNYD
jgi:hypothetical protein